MKITATKRTETGTSASKKARSEGKVPAAIYGKDVDTVSVLLNQKELQDTLREVGSNGVFEVDVEGETYQVFVKEQKSAAIKPILFHVDLLAFTKGQKVTMSIPVYITGEEEIAEGYVSQSISELEVDVAPASAPSEYTVDVSKMTIGDSISAGDIELDAETTLLTDADSTVVSISAPDAVEEETTETSDEMPEPEVIGESKEDSE
ncbi:50S ribosomal protein L25 [Marinilactibacillus sp. Marseille-P9653]|uniref:50S ribosomal protein L25 n=1 Tax=Marinilactibacillus sp. Marseille-P9653 TaxID=2866583 RepID=UPI001CE48B1E|nr:50S ribosomal protein L25 [Marinilactibacillus sp. Marseille-P9653]